MVDRTKPPTHQFSLVSTDLFNPIRYAGMGLAICEANTEMVQHIRADLRAF